MKKTMKIDGFGNISGGEYGRLEIEGMAKIKGDIDVDFLSVNGVVTSNGSIKGQELLCDGVLNLQDSIKIKKIYIDGVINHSIGNIESDFISCDGVLDSKGEISVDHLEVHGYISANEIVGDKVVIYYQPKKYEGTVSNLVNVFTGKKVSKDYYDVSLIEATRIEIHGLKVETINGEDITIGAGCEVKQVEASSSLKIHPLARVGKVIGVKPISFAG